MQDRPSFEELLDAVREFLENEVVPEQTDHRSRFRTLVAINALTILQRELSQEAAHVANEGVELWRLLRRDGSAPGDPETLRDLVLELNAELSELIRRGEAPAGTFAHLRRVVAQKLEVASPGYLARSDRTSVARQNRHGRGRDVGT
jgi:hypothetical protein